MHKVQTTTTYYCMSLTLNRLPVANSYVLTMQTADNS